MFALRVLQPAVLDTSAFSCTALSRTGTRLVSTSCAKRSADNKNIKLNPVFENRNPRALESLGIEPKPRGWKFQSPRRDFYHKLVFDKKKMHAYVVHRSGKVVVEASTKEPAVLKHLYSPNDVSAAWNLGQIISRRMLESGLTDVFYDHEEDRDIGSEKKEAFLSALKENAVSFEEAEEVKFEQIPGINYDGYNRYKEKRRWQDDYQKQ